MNEQGQPKPFPSAEPEDIFASLDINQPKTNMGAPQMTPQPRRLRKIVLVILIIIIIALLLAGGVLAYLSFIKQEPVINTNQPNANLNQPLNLNEPLNLNTNVNTNTNNANINLNLNTNTGVIIDSDHDGLSDEQEVNLGTSPTNADTDSDGLLDKEEIEIYKTNPLNPDTDGDGYLDGAEVRSGYDPNNPQPVKLLIPLQ